MAETMQFDLVSPERRLTEVEAVSVQIPGADGDLTAMVNHAPTITTLRPGIVRVSGPEGDAAFVVTGGFAEISPEGTTVLAERALPVGDVNQSVLDDFVTAAVTARDHATPEMLDQLAKQVSDIAMLASELGLSAQQS